MMRQAVAAAGGLALAIGLVGCGTTDTVSGQARPTSASGTPAGTSGAPSPGPATGGGNKTAAAAMTTFVTQVLEGHYVKACTDNLPGLKGQAPPGQDPATLCTTGKVTQSLTSLHQAWAKPGIQLPPAGTVQTTVHPQGDTVTVPDTAVTLDGHTLHDLELIGSSGDTSSFRMSFDLTKVNGHWYLSNFNIDL